MCIDPTHEHDEGVRLDKTIRELARALEDKLDVLVYQAACRAVRNYDRLKEQIEDAEKCLDESPGTPEEQKPQEDALATLYERLRRFGEDR